MDVRFKTSTIHPEGSFPHRFKESDPSSPLKSSTLVKISRNPDTTCTYLTEGKLGQYPDEYQGELVNSYYFHFLGSRSFNNAFALAKTHIESQLGLSINSSNKKRYLQRSHKHLGYHHTLTTINTVDELIQQIFRRITITDKKTYDFGRPLAFLSSVAHVKIDILFDLRNEVFTWFLNLRDKWFQRLTRILGSENPFTEKLKSLLNSTLAIAHGQLVLCSMGAVVMLDYDTSQNLNHPEILKDLWNFLKDYLTGWEEISVSEMMESLNFPAHIQYSDKLMENPYCVFQYFSRQKIDKSASSSLIWNMVRRFFTSTGKKYKIFYTAYTHDYFVRRLEDIRSNMTSHALAGVPHSKISLHFLEANKQIS